MLSQYASRFCDLLEPETSPLALFAEARATQALVAVATDAAQGAPRLGHEAPALVVAHGFHMNAGRACQHADGERHRT